jgi:hypothetical protein
MLRKAARLDDRACLPGIERYEVPGLAEEVAERLRLHGPGPAEHPGGLGRGAPQEIAMLINRLRIFSGRARNPMELITAAG